MDYKLERLKIEYESAKSWFYTFFILFISISIAVQNIKNPLVLTNFSATSLILGASSILFWVIQTIKYGRLLSYLKEKSKESNGC